MQLMLSGQHQREPPKVTPLENDFLAPEAEPPRPARTGGVETALAPRGSPAPAIYKR